MRPARGRRSNARARSPARPKETATALQPRRVAGWMAPLVAQRKRQATKNQNCSHQSQPLKQPSKEQWSRRRRHTEAGAKASAAVWEARARGRRAGARPTARARPMGRLEAVVRAGGAEPVGSSKRVCSAHGRRRVGVGVKSCGAASDERPSRSTSSSRPQAQGSSHSALAARRSSATARRMPSSSRCQNREEVT